MDDLLDAYLDELEEEAYRTPVSSDDESEKQKLRTNDAEEDDEDSETEERVPTNILLVIDPEIFFRTHAKDQPRDEDKNLRHRCFRNLVRVSKHAVERPGFDSLWEVINSDARFKVLLWTQREESAVAELKDNLPDDLVPASHGGPLIGFFHQGHMEYAGSRVSRGWHGRLVRHRFNADLQKAFDAALNIDIDYVFDESSLIILPTTSTAKCFDFQYDWNTVPIPTADEMVARPSDNCLDLTATFLKNISRQWEVGVDVRALMSVDESALEGEDSEDSQPSSGLPEIQPEDHDDPFTGARGPPNAAVPVKAATKGAAKQVSKGNRATEGIKGAQHDIPKKENSKCAKPTYLPQKQRAFLDPDDVAIRGTNVRMQINIMRRAEQIKREAREMEELMARVVGKEHGQVILKDPEPVKRPAGKPRLRKVKAKKVKPARGVRNLELLDAIV